MKSFPLIECVPNFSEGRDKSIIDQISASISSVPDVKVLHIDMGYDAHRTVITFIGSPEACEKAAFQSIKTATELIDMRLHHGAHPRMGSVDVFPFIPLTGTTLQQAIDCTIHVADRVANELQIPVYLYNLSARDSSRKLLADVRKGEYEGLENKLKTTEGKPDLGPSTFNAKSGAIIMGARKILIAYNINLNTSSVKLAKQIASRLREKNGGLPGVRAIGWYMPAFQCAQVSTNITDMDQSPVHVVFDTCKKLASEYGVLVRGSELVGLIPKECLIKTAEHICFDPVISEIEKMQIAIDYLGLNSVKKFDLKNQVIEELL